VEIVLNTERMRAKILTVIPAAASSGTIGLVSHAAHLTMTQAAPMVAVTISGAIATYFLGARAMTNPMSPHLTSTDLGDSSESTCQRIRNLEAEVERLRVQLSASKRRR
jgi:hypothetical protein